jgi:hypothetical protein
MVLPFYFWRGPSGSFRARRRLGNAPKLKADPRREAAVATCSPKRTVAESSEYAALGAYTRQYSLSTTATAVSAER